MRMESKHCYFKSDIRASKNFKNVAKTMASRHELAQVCHRYYGLFPVNKFDFPANSAPLYSYISSSSDIFIQKVAQVLQGESLILTNVKIHSTLYSPGMILVMRKQSLGVLKVGLVRIIVLQNNQVFFGCSTYTAMQSRYNYYVTTADLEAFEIISYDKLQDYHPLLKIGTMAGFRFPLHHFISSGPGE